MRDRFRTLIPVSIVGGRSVGVGINLPRPMTEAEWKQLHLILRKMKPALVVDAPTSPDDGLAP